MAKENLDKTMSRKKKKLIFYVIMMIYPVAQFCVFYIGVNLNSILLSFQSYNYGTDGTTAGYFWSGFENFIYIFSDSVFFSQNFLTALKNSLIVYVITTITSSTLPVIFSYYIFKKKFGYKFFRVILFLPQVISPMVMAVMFNLLGENILPEMLKQYFGISIKPLVSNVNTEFGAALFYSIWVSFGSSILLYNGSMASIDVSVIEAGEMDGATGIKEFIHIVFPLIYPTFSTFFIVHLAGIFTNQIALHSLRGVFADPNSHTIGYWMFRKVSSESSLANYPYLSAMGLVMTAIVVPVTLFVKWLMKKIGPSAS